MREIKQDVGFISLFNFQEKKGNKLWDFKVSHYFLFHFFPFLVGITSEKIREIKAILILIIPIT